MIIEYLGKTLKTDHYTPLTDEQYQQCVDEFYAKPDFNDVRRQILKLNKDGVRMNFITNYYFKPLMAKVRPEYTKWTVEEVLQSRDLMNYFYSKTLGGSSIFKPHMSIMHNIDTAIRLGGKGVARLPTNFPLDAANNILDKYNVNNVYLDYSCGWGVRLTSALKHNIDYCGYEPNYLLVDKLNEYAEDYKKITGSKSKVDIRCLGSQTYVEDWLGKIGVAFSSPPYFDLEDYCIGDQSYKPGMTYEDWLESYLRPTIRNMKFYLVWGGYFIINIKDTKKYPMATDAQRIAAEEGFTLVATESVVNIKRINCKATLNNNDELCYVFQEKGYVDEKN